MNDIRRRLGALRLAAVAAVVLVLVVVAWAVARFTGDDAGAQPPDPTGVAAGKPVPLTAEQCEAAADIVDGMRADRARVAEKIGTAGVAAMDAAIEESAAWVAAGCPPDDVLGYYPNPNGPGGELRIFRQQTFGQNGMTEATMGRTD